MMDIQFNIICHPEHSPIKGNAMCSGDAAFDAKVERRIARQLRNGNEWAWCMVEVTGFNLDTGEEASTYLGQCSYKNKLDFVQGGYYQDMLDEVRDMLEDQMEV